VGALIVKGSNFMHNRHTIRKKIPIFFLWSLCNSLSTSSIFSAVLFVGLFCQNTTCFQKHIYAFVDFLGKLLVKSPETFVEIPQKLEVSNKTIRRSQVFLHF
jgi:hypothetical protein